MQVIRDNDDSSPSLPGCAATIGVYDGVHLGHQAVIGETQARAGRLNLPTVVVTFDRHPATVLQPSKAPALLTTLEQKLELLEQVGVDYTYLVHFDKDRAQEEAPDFVRRVLVGRLGARAVIVGADFHFGHHRGGDVDLLAAMGQELGFTAEGLGLLPSPAGTPEPVSSTAIRRVLAGGDVEAAATMLGRPYELRGVVARGDERGRGLGFPTANVPVSTAMCIPADAVYAGWYVEPDGTRHMAAINLGRRPTFYEHAEKSLLEAHLLDFEGDLYDRAARVQFVKLLRSEMRFDSVDALRDQLQLDVAMTRQLLSR